MKLWKYLKGRMQQYGNKTAFAKSGITYADLCSLDGNPSEKSGELMLCEGETREEQAFNIIKYIANGIVVVPISEDYGKLKAQFVRQQICNDKNRYSDIAFILFTSGSTGSSKGVMLSDENVICNLEYIFGYFDLSGMERICIARPLVHVAVLVGELLYALCNGLTIYFFEESFIPLRLLSYLKHNEINVFCATPTMFFSLSKCIEKEVLIQYEKIAPKRIGELTSLHCRAILEKIKSSICPIKICVTSGEILTVEIAEKLSKAFPDTKFYNVYGLTEHSPRVCALMPEDFMKKTGSVGKAIGKVKMKIVDGELYVKSPCIMQGYYNNKKATHEKIKDGWLNTGDLAHCDDEGYYYIDGRKDDMIIRAGVNIFPQEIERVTSRCDGIEDCVVFGERDSKYGQKIILQFAGLCDTADLKRFLLRTLPIYLIPDKIEKVENMKKTASGKKLRRRLK